MCSKGNQITVLFVFDSPYVIFRNKCYFHQILLKGGCRLLEPIMSIEIVSPSDRISQILSDLSKRRATILNVGSKGEFNKVISALLFHNHTTPNRSYEFLFCLKTGHQCASTTSRIKWLFECGSDSKLRKSNDEHATTWIC